MQDYRIKGIVSSMESDLGVHPNHGEAHDYFQDRLLLSATSSWMHWLVHSHQDSISIVRLTQETEIHIETLISAFGKSKRIDAGKLTQYVYETLMQNGDFYHIPLYVRPAAYHPIPVIHATLVRGMEPGLDVAFSGLAPYIKDAADPVDLHDHFDVSDNSPVEILDYVWKHAPLATGANLQEYLQPDVPPGRQYYSLKCPSPGRLTLARNALGSQQYEYFLSSGSIVKRIPNEWTEIGYHEYCRLALMNQYGTRTTQAVDFGETVKFQPACLLPRRELSFMRYISWPSDITNPESPWSFQVSTTLWPTVKQRLEYLGYKVSEL